MQALNFRMICLFRSRHTEDIKEIFVEVVRLCANLGMVGLEHIVFDGTKLKAIASVRQTREKESLEKEIGKVEEEIDKLLERSEEVDASEDNDGSGIPEEIKDREYRLKKLEEARKQLEEEKNTEGCIPDNKLESLDGKEESEKRYDKSNFVYNEYADQYSCPEGKILASYTETRQNGREQTIYHGTDCSGCPVKTRCIKAQARTITRGGREPLQEKMREGEK